VCVCVFVCVRVCSCVWVCVSVIFMCVCVFVCIGEYIAYCNCRYMHIYIYTHMYICICICLYIYTYISIYLHTYTYTCVKMYIYIYVYINIHIRIYTYIYVFVYTYTYAHICTWYMYIFMFISTYAACRLVKYTHSLVYEVATISSRLPKNIGLFCKEPYKRHYILQKRLIILRSLLIVVTPSHDISFFIHLTPCFNLWNDAFMPMTSDLSIINRCVFSQLHVK